MSYQEQLETKFLAPATQVMPNADCVDIPRIITQEVLVDSSGYYAGDPTFRYSDAIYRMEYSNLRVDQQGYEELMDKAKESFDSLG